MEIVNNVTAQEFIQVVFSNRQEQSNVVGKWFSPKETGEQIKTKAKKYLANYQNYVSYLEKVVQLPVEDLDKELFKAKIQQQSNKIAEATKNMSDEEKQLMIQTLQG